MLSVLCARAMIDSMGFLLFDTPVSLLLLLPVLAGIAVGIGSDNTARLPLPEHRRLIPARLAWLAFLAVLAGSAVSLGQLAGPDITWQPGARNLMLHASLAVATVRLLGPAMAWLPPVTLTLVAMLFGYPPSEPGYYWWAMIMEETVTVTHWGVTATAFTLAAALYAFAPVARGHVGRFSRTRSPAPGTRAE
ncbi:hypothetical protein [Streptomyces sp. NPDC002133]|uniref:hypothetical protein n=1 Tax=Streptomyces sp. NPDC002133 TaxID=3154409 RepID=UPI0033276CB2